MSRKILIPITIVLTLVLLGLGLYYYSLNSNSTVATGTKKVFKNFFPFGGNENGNGTVNEGEENGNTNGSETNNPSQVDFTQKLRKLSAEPVSGAGLLDIKAGTIVRYVEKATGHIFEVELFSPNKNRISNTTIPLIYEALWGNKNNSFVARYLKDDNETIDTYSLTIKNPSSTTPSTIGGTLLGTNITDVSVFGSSIFELQESFSGSIGIVLNFDNTGKKQIWNSPIKEINPQFFSSKTIALNTKPKAGVNGYLYFVDTSTAAVKQVLGNIPGLVSSVNSDGSQILIYSQGVNASLNSYDTKTKAFKTVNPVTFPEKCVWSKKNINVVYCGVPRENLTPNSLEDWYKGKITFSDDIWKYDFKAGTSSIVSELNEENTDVIKSQLSDSEQYLIFVNKTNNSLWSLDLTK
jgi:hypothetical protein